jgi:hypothetical protein
MDLVSKFERLEMHHARKRITKRKRDNDELVVNVAFTSRALNKFLYNFHRFWVDARSSNWICCWMDGALLQEKQFAKCFHMNQNSFYTLHGLLGTYQDWF